MTTSNPTPVKRKSFSDMMADCTPSVAQVRNAAADYVPAAAGIALMITGIVTALNAGSFAMSLLYFWLFLGLSVGLATLLMIACELYVRPESDKA